MTTPTNPLEPMAPRERLLHLDVIRGLSLLGVLLVNILVFGGAIWYLEAKEAFPLGRMALTQYLLQSVACSLVFYGFGLGLYGKVPMNLLMLLGLALYALQVWSSHLWLTHFRLGPAEWLWRGLTYGSFPAFRKRSEPEEPQAVLVKDPARF